MINENKGQGAPPNESKPSAAFDYTYAIPRDCMNELMQAINFVQSLYQDDLTNVGKPQKEVHHGMVHLICLLADLLRQEPYK